VPGRTELLTHRLINRERRRRRIAPVTWDYRLYKLAREHSRAMAHRGHLFHSARPALQGGENCYMGPHNAYTIVKTWMRSPGHRAWLLDRRVKTAAVALWRGRSRRAYWYASWSFSAEALPGRFRLPRVNFDLVATIFRGFGGLIGFSYSSVLGAFWVLVSILAVVLGAHGLYVYFNPMDVLFGGNTNKLFLTFGVPSVLQRCVEWMSMRGFQSWVIPAAVLFGGLWLWLNVGREIVDSFLTKVKRQVGVVE